MIAVIAAGLIDAIAQTGWFVQAKTARKTCQMMLVGRLLIWVHYGPAPIPPL